MCRSRPRNPETHLFRQLELLVEDVVETIVDVFRLTGGHLDEDLGLPVEQVVDDLVVVVVVSNAEEALHHVPDGLAELARVHALHVAHAAIERFIGRSVRLFS